MRKFFATMALLLFAASGLADPQLALAAPPFYKQHNLVSDTPGVADLVDPRVVNAWGLAASSTGPWWIANEGSDSSTLFNAAAGTIPTLVVSIPGGAPTGLVFNSAGAGTFVVTNGTASGSAAFIFASATGIISGWSAGVPPPAPSMQAQIAVTVPDAIYTGLAIAGTGAAARLYAANFHAGTVDVFDNTFTQLTLPAGAFVDPNLPAGFAPFGIQTIGGTIYVTYAMQDEDQEEEVAGPGLGYVNAYDTAGNFMRRVASAGALNAPWGVALAPDDFGAFGGKLLIGNFGDGRINAYDLAASTSTGEAELVGPMHGASGPPLQIEGLWALQFGNGGSAGPKNKLYFTAGPQDEEHGLFGSIEPAEPPGRSR
jgi:uncharacterized protein (TIGR03118 family)